MSTRGHSHMRGLVPQDGLFGGSGAADLIIERGPGEGCSQKGRGFAPHAAVIHPMLINGRLRGEPGPGLRDFIRPRSTAAFSGSAGRVNVEHAQRSEHERR